MVRGSRGTASRSASSFSGINPTDRIRQSHATRSSVPGMGRMASSTSLISTASSRRRPKVRVTVRLV